MSGNRLQKRKYQKGFYVHQKGKVKVESKSDPVTILSPREQLVSTNEQSLIRPALECSKAEIVLPGYVKGKYLSDESNKSVEKDEEILSNSAERIIEEPSDFLDLQEEEEVVPEKNILALMVFTLFGIASILLGLEILFLLDLGGAGLLSMPFISLLSIFAVPSSSDEKKYSELASISFFGSVLAVSSFIGVLGVLFYATLNSLYGMIFLIILAVLYALLMSWIRSVYRERR